MPVIGGSRVPGQISYFAYLFRDKFLILSGSLGVRWYQPHGQAPRVCLTLIKWPKLCSTSREIEKFNNFDNQATPAVLMLSTDCVQDMCYSVTSET